MSPLAQLLERHRERLLEAPPALWLNPPADLPRDLIAAHARCFVQDEALRRTLAERGVAAAFGAWPPALESTGTAVFTLPREKARLRMMAHALAGAVGAHGSVLAVGEIRAGARSAARHLESFFGEVLKKDTARHCVLYEAHAPRTDTTADNAGAGGSHAGDTGCEAMTPFRPADYLSRWRLDRPDGPLTICSLPGVFAHGALDAGTALLLDGLDNFAKGAAHRVLDLGCGAGVIGLALRQIAPSIDLVMADSNALALEATRASLTANDAAATVVASDGLSAIRPMAVPPDGTPFDLVISNPPFHEGHRERQDRGAGVFAGIEEILVPGGRLVIVVNRHLPWPRWLDATFGSHEVLARNGRFQVLSARCR